MLRDVTRAHAAIARILRANRDIIAERVDDAREPGWSETRGWGQFLSSLSDEELARCEAEGLAQVAPSLSAAPESLCELAASVRAAERVPRVIRTAAAFELPLGADPRALRGVSQRKRAQVASLLGAVERLAASAKRIVDVGAGSGHFARLAATRFDREALGLERDRARVRKAQARAQREAVRAEFVEIDVGRAPLELEPGDLAVGLHACGELGDTLVRRVAKSHADLVLVSCCLQKIQPPVRSPLSSAGVALERATLGLSNLSARSVGVEAGLGLMLEARETRHALRRLLLARGLEVEAGAEIRGLNRRAANAGLSALAERALALRGLAPATHAEIAAHERAAHAEYSLIRRLSLPRNMLARCIELAVIFDRAQHLHESGQAVLVAALVDSGVTPRNLALFASSDRARLPETSANEGESSATV